MELAFIVYLISILGSLSVFFGVMCFAAILTAVIMAGIKLLCMEDNTADSLPYGHKSVIAVVATGVFLGGISALLPSERAGYVIASAYAAQRIAENDNVQEIGGKVVKLLNQKLDEALGDKKERAK